MICHAIVMDTFINISQGQILQTYIVHKLYIYSTLSNQS
jgi:hypothetical protein